MQTHTDPSAVRKYLSQNFHEGNQNANVQELQQSMCGLTYLSTYEVTQQNTSTFCKITFLIKT